MELLPDKKAKTVAEFLQRATDWFWKYHCIRFKAILSDNGKEYTWHTERGREFHSFEKMMKKLDIRHKYTRVCRPQTNGKAERFWRVLSEEFATRYQFSSWKEFNLLMKKWLHHYNTYRKHGGIEYQTPVQKNAFLLPLSLLCHDVGNSCRKIVTEIV